MMTATELAIAIAESPFPSWKVLLPESFVDDLRPHLPAKEQDRETKDLHLDVLHLLRSHCEVRLVIVESHSMNAECVD